LGTIGRCFENQFPLFDDQLSEEVKIQIAALQADEARYRLIFNSMPVGLWEQDFSAVKKAIEELKLKGITDFEAYLTNILRLLLS
jgi:PAS domain-containing protein